MPERINRRDYESSLKSRSRQDGLEALPTSGGGSRLSKHLPRLEVAVGSRCSRRSKSADFERHLERFLERASGYRFRGLSVRAWIGTWQDHLR